MTEKAGGSVSSSSFRIAFEGEPFAEGEIDVNDLAPALLALGDVIQAANRALNGDRADARLKIRATNEGIRSSPPMIADNLRRQVDNFIEFEELKDIIGWPPRPMPVEVTAADEG